MYFDHNEQKWEIWNPVKIPIWFKVIKILKARSYQHLNFWLELAWIGAKCKGKTLLVIEIFFTFFNTAQLLSIQRKTWSSFLNSFAELAQKFKFLSLAVLWSDSMKRNSRWFTFNKWEIIFKFCGLLRIY